MGPGSIGPERWRRLSPLLDEALDLAAAERAAWLEALGKSEPGLAADLERMLADHAASEEARFLAGVAAPAAAAADLDAGLAGQTLGAYTLERPIGHGGMGSVWLAHRSDGRYAGAAAVKLLNVSLIGRSGGERFKREGSILARLTHPHIARLLDAGVTGGGQPYLVLEYVEGKRIDRWCDDENLDVAARVRLFLDVLGAAAHSHANLIVHRDIKPDNVLLAGDAAVVTDFGIAKAITAARADGGSSTLTTAGSTLGTPAYMSPEQATGDPTADFRSDIYSFGCLAFEMITGKVLFEAANEVMQITMHLAHDGFPQPMQSLMANPEVGPLAEVLVPTLRRDPRHRPTAEELRADIKAVAAMVDDATWPAPLGGPR